MSDCDEKLLRIMLEKLSTKLSQLDARFDAIETMMSRGEQPVEDDTTTQLLLESVEQFEHDTPITWSPLEHSSEDHNPAGSFWNNYNILDSEEIVSQMVDGVEHGSMDTDSSKAENSRVTFHESSPLGLHFSVYQHSIQHITVNTLTCFRGFAPEAPSCLTACGSHNKVWDPGLYLA